jgi:hypothetical protein
MPTIPHMPRRISPSEAVHRGGEVEVDAYPQSGISTRPVRGGSVTTAASGRTTRAPTREGRRQAQATTTMRQPIIRHRIYRSWTRQVAVPMEVVSEVQIPVIENRAR